MPQYFRVKVDDDDKRTAWRIGEYLAGRLRQGWGPRNAGLLEDGAVVPFDVWRDRYLASAQTAWDEEHRRKWKIEETVEERHRRLNYMLRMEVGDILLIPDLLVDGEIELAMVDQPYRFQTPVDINDFGHIVGVEPLGSVGRADSHYDDVNRVARVMGSISPIIDPEHRKIVQHVVEQLLIESTEDSVIFDNHLSRLGSDHPTTRSVESSRFERDSRPVAALKRLYEFHCQLCGLRISSGPPGRFYAEVHHLESIGGPDAGSDRPSNAVVVCPNCHVRLQIRGIAVEPETLAVHDARGNIVFAQIALRHELDIDTLHRVWHRFRSRST
jgi:hypothetical protein